MIRHTFRTVALALALTVCALSARADFEAGKAAWDGGRYTEALAEWLAAVDTDDRRAMLALGRLYLQGLGAPQNYVEAYMWFSLAASRGEQEAVAKRDALSERMTPASLAEAQQRATAWHPSADRTAAALEMAAPAPAARDPGPPPPRAIREAQALLSALGYAPGPADGVWGPRVGAAYAAFLRDAGLPAAEILTPEVLRAMRESAGAGAEAAVAPALAQEPAPLAPREAIPPDALHRAAAAGDLDGLRSALGAGADPNARDGRGRTALMVAVDEGYTLLVPPLLAAGADLDVRAPDGATALFIAAMHRHSEIIALLMKAGADVSVKGPRGKTARDVAQAVYGDVETVRKGNARSAVIALLQGKTLKKTFRDCDECPEMVVAPAGSFSMGSPFPQYQVFNESPRHSVTISEPFAIGKYEVTFDEWDACVVAGGCGGYSPGDEGWGRGRRPVMNVNWGDAKAYVRWLLIRTGEFYRLLSEAEWEYAARAGTVGRFHFGHSISTEQANFDGRYTRVSGRSGVKRGETVPIGSFPANEFGLHDVHGNVAEWVEDCWHDNYFRGVADGGAWISGGDCGMRVLRGGAWNDFPPYLYLRSAARSSFEPGHRYYDIGFRVARMLRGPKGKTASDVVRTVYGDAETTHGKNADPAVVDLEHEPKCAELGNGYRNEHDAACWQEMQSQPGCYAWNNHYHSDRALEWTGSCAGGVAIGRGAYTLEVGSGHEGVTAIGSFLKGKQQGWSGQHLDDGSVIEGSYADSYQHGHWVTRYADGDYHRRPLCERQETWPVGHTL